MSTTTDVGDAILKFFLYDVATKASTELFYLKTELAGVNNGRLADLRRVVAASGQQKEYATYIFCSDTGSLVPDDWLVKDYVATYGQMIKASPNPTTVYIKKPELRGRTPADPVAAPILDLTLPDSAKLTQAQALEVQKSLYNAVDFRALASTTAATYVSELGEKEWSIVARNNSLFNGITIDRLPVSGSTSVTPAGVNIARRPAFQFKRRDIPSYSFTIQTVNDTLMSLRVPNYVVDDQSYVTVFETKDTFQSSLAMSSFTEADVKAAVSGGAFGFSIGVSAGYSQSASDASASSTLQSTNRMHISYNFPRVTLILDEESLELTDQCKTDIASVRDSASLTKFLSLYGQFFSSRIQLGGRLFASDESSTIAGSSAADKAKAMKASAAVAFSGYGASASVSASYGSSTNQSSSSSSNAFSSNLTWQANGGNTLLCNNPPAWCPTVASFQNWRVTKQDNVAHILDVIGKIPGYTQIPALFKAMNPTVLASQVVVPDRITLEMKDKSPKQLLTASTPGYCSLAASMNRMISGKSIPSATAPSSFSSIGALIGDLVQAESAVTGQIWEVTTANGEPVLQAKYETRYVLRNSATSLSFSYHGEASRYWPKSTSSWVPTLIFRNPSGSRSADTIQTGSQVQIAFSTSDITPENAGFNLVTSGTYNSDFLVNFSTTLATFYLRR